MTSQAMGSCIGVLFDRNFEFNKILVQGKYELFPSEAKFLPDNSYPLLC